MVLARRFVIAAALIATSLAIAPTSYAGADTGGTRITPRTGLSVGFMPMRHAAARTASSFAASAVQPPVDFTYRGGPVLSNAAVENVVWGSGGTFLPEVAGTSPTTDIGTIMTEMFSSPWAHSLSEYSTPTQTIGTASVIDRRSITPSVAASGSTIDDSTIQSELISQVTSGALTAPTANTIYTLYFPQGTTVCDAAMGGTPVACSPQSGADNSHAFCAYHGATESTYNGQHLLYVVQPYPDAFYVGGCGAPGAQSSAESLESVVSHELSETITDPLVALNDASQIGWYDDNYGEVADLCQAGYGPWTSQDDSVGYRDSANTWFHVQQVWSNSDRACVPGPPRRLQATRLVGGHVRLTWAAPADQSQDPAQGYEIYEANSSGVREVGYVTGGTWTSPSLPYGHPVFFEVIAAAQANGLFSHRISDAVQVVPASSPSAVPWVRTLRAGTSPIVGWGTAPANYSAITKYVLTGPGGTRSLSPTTRSFHWRYLRHGRYLITVRAVNQVGYGTIRKFYLVN